MSSYIGVLFVICNTKCKAKNGHSAVGLCQKLMEETCKSKTLFKIYTVRFSINVNSKLLSVMLPDYAFLFLSLKVY